MESGNPLGALTALASVPPPPLSAMALALGWAASALAQEMTAGSGVAVDPTVDALARILGSGGLPAVAMAALVLLRGWVPMFRIEHIHRMDQSEQDAIRRAVDDALDRREPTEERKRTGGAR